MDMLENVPTRKKSTSLPILAAAVLFGGLSQIGNIAGQNIESEMSRRGYVDKNGNPLKGDHVFFATVTYVAPEDSINILNTKFNRNVSFTLRTEFDRNIEVTANLLGNNNPLNNKYYEGQVVKVRYSEDNGTIFMSIFPVDQNYSPADFKLPSVPKFF